MAVIAIVVPSGGSNLYCGPFWWLLPLLWSLLVAVTSIVVPSGFGLYFELRAGHNGPASYGLVKHGKLVCLTLLSKKWLAPWLVMAL